MTSFVIACISLRCSSVSTNTSPLVPTFTVVAVWLVCAQHLDLELGIEFADVGHWHAHVKHRFYVAFEDRLRRAGFQEVDEMQRCLVA
jgi:hypothetical protein